MLQSLGSFNLMLASSHAQTYTKTKLRLVAPFSNLSKSVTDKGCYCIYCTSNKFEALTQVMRPADGNETAGAYKWGPLLATDVEIFFKWGYQDDPRNLSGSHRSLLARSPGAQEAFRKTELANTMTAARVMLVSDVRTAATVIITFL